MSETAKLDFLSLGLALVLGTAALPHVLMRFYTVPTAKEARKSVVWAIWLIGIFYVFTLVLGYGAAALVGPEVIAARPAASNSAAPLLAFELGGPVLLGLISAIAFATILAVVAGLTITAAASFAHDIYANVVEEGQGRARRRGQGRPSHGRRDRHHRDHRRHRGERPERGVPRGAGVRGRGIRQPADDRVLAVLEAVHAPRARCGACTAGSRRRSSSSCSRRSCLGHARPSMIPGADFDVFPLSNPGIVSIPLAFLLGWLGTVLDKRKEDAAKQSEMEVRSLTGVGAEKATNH